MLQITTTSAGAAVTHTTAASGDKLAAGTGEAVVSAAEGSQLAPKITDERHVSFEEEGVAQVEERPKKTFHDLTAREKWLWSLDKVMAQIAVSTIFLYEFYKN